MTEFQEEIPIKAESLTNISFSTYIQQILFYYSDSALIYYHYKELGELDSILEDISDNMQYHVNSDKIYINERLINLKIIKTSLSFDNNDNSLPVLKFIIKNESIFNLMEKRINEIRLDAELDIVSYPITSLWVLPGKVIQVKTNQKYNFSNCEINFSSEPGKNIGGEEIIIFKHVPNIET